MKDKSINQLLDIVRADDTYLHAGDEILRRVEELEKELLKYTKAFSTLWNYYKELDKERISLSIQVSQAEEQVERLKDIGVERDNALVAYENLKVCSDHWKTSYETMKQYKKKSWHKHEVLKEILDFYSRWKGISQEWNSSLRTKRDRESWKIIKEVVLKINRWKTINDGSQTD